MDARSPIRRRLVLGAAVLVAAVAAATPASAIARDRNHDRIADRWERQHGLSLSKKQGRRDQDRDGLRNRGEFRAGFLPRDPDTDDDGVEDGDEGAGVIAAFDPLTGELTIDSFAGPSLTGFVTDETEIECENDDATEPDDLDDEDELGEDDDELEDDDRATARDDDGDECSVADLTPGRVVSEAELELDSTGLVWEEIELA